ncbi:CusB/HlyD membrane fusion family barrel-sandwich protein [Sphingobacterium sp. JUb78]|nr:CusB/HlyD membrane fusion family barrel-sandwich protein [Sphingobacterium sp. JUb78]
MMTMACTSDKKPKTSHTNKQILQDITEIKAIGKIIPSEDWAIIASTTAAIIKQVLIKEGDTVQAGELLVLLDKGNITLDIEQEQTKLNAAVTENRTTVEDIEKANLNLKELQAKYETSKRLFAQNAESKEVMETDLTSWRQQELTLKGLQEKRRAQQIKEHEQYLQIQKIQNQENDFNINARKSGIIMDLTAKVGQSVGNANELGKIVNVSNPIIEAEVDELFAQDVKIGQSVTILPVGRKDNPTTGQIFYISPILSNKSILYETANEGEDRRVRKIKIQVNNNNQLPINAKVDCTIKMK